VVSVVLLVTPSYAFVPSRVSDAEPMAELRRWKALVKTAGVTPITLHGARHSYAELALSAGVRLDVVSRQLGHASIATTETSTPTTPTRRRPTPRNGWGTYSEEWATIEPRHE
jgi:integrase